MEYYLILLAIYFICGLKEVFIPVSSKYKKIYTFILLFPIFILVAFRSKNIGNDTIHYMYAYESIPQFNSLNDFISDSRMEHGYLILSWMCNKIGFSYLTFQCLISTLMYISFYNFFKKYAFNIGLSCFLFITMFKMGATMNVVRMYCALSILLFATPYILNRKFKPFLIMVLLATLFHSSASVYIILYPLCVIKYNKKILLGIIIASFVIAGLGASFFQWFTGTVGLYEGYVNEERFENMNHTAVIIGLVTTAIIYLYAKLVGTFQSSQYYNRPISTMQNTKSISIVYFCQISLIITLALSIIGLTNNIMGRVSGYFSMVLILILGYTFTNIRDLYAKVLTYILIVSLYFAYFCVILTYRPDWNHLVPYEWGI